MIDPALDVKAGDVLVLKRIGHKGVRGMPEAGYLPIPLKLARDVGKGDKGNGEPRLAKAHCNHIAIIQAAEPDARDRP
jgi:hypothetical protein